MPIANIQDAREVERSLRDILSAPDADGAAQAIRTLFVETLDYDYADLRVTLKGADPNLPPDARLLARRDGVSTLYIPLDHAEGNQATGAVASAAARVIGNVIADEPLLLFTNRDRDELHVIYPDLSGSRPNLQRMVAHRERPNRTVVQQLANLWHDYGVLGKPMGEAVRNAFNVQPVTEAFFKDYKAAYDAAVVLLTGQLEQQDAEQFAQTLFNRLLFIHFVSRKGWLRFNSDADYLNALWQDYRANAGQSNFYTERLTVLFFAGLNNPQALNLMRDNPALCALIGEPPFLNGGLFERNPLDHRAAAGEFAVPDGLIEPLLTGLFRRYNFTVMEATPLDTEVAVDPEMLGKLFEETVNERHSNGAYYTPRPVVAFMCREAIKGYLDGRGISGLDGGKIADLVDDRNPDAITTQQALEVANAVAAMKAVDPACGSGAFLLGMLQEILALNDTLFRAGKTPESLYRQKLDIITNNIYGADKDALAVSTAMLRLWLSLAVDYDGEGTPDPLPNLDLKLMAGDAIAGPDPQQLDFTLQSIVNSGLQQDIAAYTTAQGQRKASLKDKVEATKRELRENMRDAAPDGVVEWRIDFADVMLNGGFDVVIANPPYVRQEDIGPQKDVLARKYAAATTARSDLYCYFYARGLQLLRDGGMHVFVCSNSWLDVGYGAKLQEHLLKSAHIRAVYESAVERQFATADINTVISLIRKTGAPANGDETRFVSLRGEFDTALADAIQRREIVRSRAQLRAGGTAGGKFTGDKWGGKYLRAPDIYHHILDNYSDKLVRLGDVAAVRRGITTGANDFFYLTPERIAEFGIEPEYCRPVMTTPQESRSIAVDPATLPKRLFMCHADKEELAGTGALAYIQWGEAQGYHKNKSFASKAMWWDIGPTNPAHLAINTLVDTTARTFYCPSELLFDQTCYTVTANWSLRCLCAGMNSTLFQLMANLGGRANFGGGLLRIATYELANLVVVNPALLPEPNTTVFNTADWDVLAPSAARRHIDAAVFDALGLTAGERDAVYAGVAELVGNRRRRAGNVQGASSAAAQKQTASKPEFRVVPNHSGLAPGVDAGNLKDIVHDLEDDELLEKLTQ